MKTSILGKRSQKSKAFKLFASYFFWNDNRSQWFQYLYEILSNFQLICIVFVGSFKALLLQTSEGSPIKLAQSIVQVLALTDASPIINSKITISVIYSIISLYFLIYIGLIGFLAFNVVKGHKVSDKFRLWLTYWVQSHHTLLFWIFNYFLISLFSKALSKNGPIFRINENNVGAIVAVTIPITLNYSLALMGALFCYDPFLTNNAFACYNSTFQILAFFSKAILGPVLSLVDSQSLKWPFVCISLVFSFARHELILYELPFYTYSSLKLCALMSGAIFSISLVAFIAGILVPSSPVTSIDFVYVCIVVVFLVSKVTTRRIHIIIERNLAGPLTTLTSHRDIFKRVFSLSYYANQSSFSPSFASKNVCNQALLVLTGDMSSHSPSCSNNKCLCKYVLEKNIEPQSEPTTCLFKLHNVSKTLNLNRKLGFLHQAINLVKGNNIFKILYAFVLMKEEQNFLASQILIFEIQENQRAFQDEVLISIFNRECEKEMLKCVKNTEYSENMLTSKQIVDIETDSEHMFCLIKQNTEAYADLWTFYYKNNVSLREFIDKSTRFENEAEDIQQVWNKMSIRNPYLPIYISVLYSTYLALVRNLPYQAEKIYNRKEIKQRQNIDEILDQDQDNINDRSDMIFYISMSKERLGRILHVSRNIYKELGWLSAEILKQNINVIQPPFIREKHNRILLMHKENNKGRFTNTFNLFAQTKEGFLVPIDGYVAIFPYVEVEPIYVGIIQRKEISKEVMIIRSEGSVDSFSKGIARELGLEPYSKIHINQICPELRSATMKLGETGIEDQELLSAEEEILTFQPYSLGSGLSKRELAYRARSKKISVLGENFLCLYLSFCRTSENSHRKLIERVPTNDSNNIEEILADEVPVEFESSPEVIVTRVSESPLLTAHKMTPSVNYTAPQSSFKRIKITAMTPDSNGKKQESSTIQIEERVPDIKKMFVREDSKTSSVMRRGDAQKKVEQAMYIIPKPRYMRLLNYQVGLFAVICVSLLCFQLIDNISQLDSLSQKIDIISNCETGAYYLTVSNLRTKMLTLIIRGIFSDKRHLLAGVPSYTSNLKSTLILYFATMNQINSQMMRDIHMLDKKTQEEIHNIRITMRQKSDNVERKVTLFEMMSEVANAANMLNRMNLYNISITNPVMNFILDNTVNEPLLAMEQTCNAMTKDYESNLYILKAKTLLISIIALVSGLSIMITLYFHIKEIVVKRNQLILLLQTTNENLLKEHLHIVSQFSNSLSTEKFNIKTYTKLKNDLLELRDPSDGKAIKRRGLQSRKGLNNQLIKGVLFTVGAIMIFVSVFVILFFKFESKLQDFMRKKDKMLKVDQLRTEIILENLCFLTYLTQTTPEYVRNNPVGDELMNIFSTMEAMVEMMAELVDEIEGPDRAILQSMLIGDFCQIAINPNYPIVLCVTVARAIGSTGLIGLISNYARVIKDWKTQFEVSNRSYRVALVAVNSKDAILYEEIALFMDSGVAMVQNIFKSDLKQSVADYRKQIMLIILIYGAIYLILGCFLSVKVWRGMAREREKWRKVLRQVPFSMMLANRPLKNYLINDCEHVLDSYKNSL